MMSQKSWRRNILRDDFPAISIPNGVSIDGLPLDIQFMAPHFGEDLLFTVGKAYENDLNKTLE